MAGPTLPVNVLETAMKLFPTRLIVKVLNDLWYNEILGMNYYFPHWPQVGKAEEDENHRTAQE